MPSPPHGSTALQLAIAGSQTEVAEILRRHKAGQHAPGNIRVRAVGMPASEAASGALWEPERALQNPGATVLLDHVAPARGDLTLPFTYDIAGRRGSSRVDLWNIRIDGAEPAFEFEVSLDGEVMSHGFAPVRAGARSAISQFAFLWMPTDEGRGVAIGYFAELTNAEPTPTARPGGAADTQAGGD